MEGLVVRQARPQDIDELASLFHELWPDGSIEEHCHELVPILAGHPPGTLPLTVLVVEGGDQALSGFVEVGLRSHADGCDPAVPVGFVEGWYVAANLRRSGIGAQLLAAAESWARGQRCVEMASDTWLDNDVSQRVHEALGFEVVDRCVHYRKLL